MGLKKTFRWFILYLISTIFYLSCSSFDEETFFTDEFLRFYADVDKVCIYAMEQGRKFLTSAVDIETNLYTEEYIRCEGDVHVFKAVNVSQQCEFILALLFSARQVKINQSENVIQTVKEDGVIWYKDSGMVIDIFKRDGEIITYIMQNGLPIFYKKNSKDVLYEMPKPLLEKFFINEKEFVNEVKNLKLNEPSSGCVSHIRPFPAGLN
jgi:hypothetical protein